MGCNLSFSGDPTDEIQRRVNLASSAFCRLIKRVFSNRNLTEHTKIAVYEAVVIATILYGCESWVPYRRHIRPLEFINIRRLQLIHGLRWWNKVTHSEIRSWAEVPSIESMLLHCLLRWLIHVIRMPDSRLPHRVLYGQLKHGYRSVGGQKNRFKDHINALHKKSNIPFNMLEALASDRATCRTTCAYGISCLDAEYNRVCNRNAIANTSMTHRPAHLSIPLTKAHFVANNATPTLASTATVKIRINDKEEDVIIQNGWSPEEIGEDSGKTMYILILVLECNQKIQFDHNFVTKGFIEIFYGETVFKKKNPD